MVRTPDAQNENECPNAAMLQDEKCITTTRNCTVPSSTVAEIESPGMGGMARNHNIFREVYKAFLVPGANGTGYKCRLHPTTRLSTWDDFKRHCDTAKAHPLKIFFCNHCGEPFTRWYALTRHCKNLPSKCIKATPEEAMAKRTVIRKAHDEFIGRLERWLETGEDFGMPFL